MGLKKFIKNKIRNILTVNVQEKVVANIVSLPPNEYLKNRIAIVTGGTGGIGKAVAIAFANAGADVIITSRNYSKVLSVAEEINNANLSGKIYGFELDVTETKDLKSKFAEIEELVGQKTISILVNNAGIDGGSFRNTTEDVYDKVMETNLKGAFFMSQVFADYVISRKIKANILNIVSSSGIRPAVSPYMLSKWGLRGLTEGLARILAPKGIIVNGIAPGPTATAMQPSTKDGDITWPLNLLGRMAVPEEIANMAVFLVSSMGQTIIGDIIYMSGGGGIITNEDYNYKY